MSAINLLKKVVVRIQMKSLVPKDAAQFDFHLMAPAGATDTDYDHASVRLETFFNAIATKLSGAFSTSTSSWTADFYEVPSSVGALGPPQKHRAGTIWAGGGSGNYPSEVAVCLSLRADITGIAEHGPGGTRPAATRRNRIYLGPMYDGSAQIDGASGAVHVSAATLTQITNAAVALKTNLNADGWKWMIFSPKNWQQYEAVTAWCDNAFDTQRRRGTPATSRTLVTLP